MPPHLLPPEPQHLRRLPSGRELAAILHRLRVQQGREILRSLRGDPERPVPDLATRWLDPMLQALALPVGLIFVHGMEQTTARLSRQTGRRLRSLAWRYADVRQGVGIEFGLVPAGRGAAVRKEDGQPQGVSSPLPGSSTDPFGVFRPEVRVAVQNLTLTFCRETLATACGDVQEAMAKLRRELDEGLVEGDPTKEINRRVGEIFGDPRRAAAIGQTEASRSMHGGEIQAARDSQVVSGKEWLSSADACDFCQSLAALGEIPLDQDFIVKGTGPYARVPHPPGHPF